MKQGALCEHALTKTNRKPVQNHQIKTVLLFKTYTLEFEFDRNLEHMVGFQGIQSGLSMFLVDEFGAFKIFMFCITVLQSLIFHYLKLQTSKIDHIWIDYDHILSFTNQKSALLQFVFIYEA